MNNFVNKPNICQVCEKSADVSCTCYNSLRFWSLDNLLCHKQKNDHQPINLPTNRQEVQVNECKIIKKKIEKTSKEVKNKPIKLSKNVHKMKKELKSDFNLLLEAHTDLVCCVIVTCDNKYIISGSKDKTIRI